MVADRLLQKSLAAPLRVWRDQRATRHVDHKIKNCNDNRKSFEAIVDKSNRLFGSVVGGRLPGIRVAMQGDLLGQWTLTEGQEQPRPRLSSVQALS